MSKLTQVSITNFQSIKEADFDVSGLTVLVGPGDVGKSAVLRAIIAALTNQQGDDFIRDGEKACAVELTFDDGVSIFWRKTRSKSAEYIFNDRSFTKTVGQVPEPIAEYLRVAEFEIDANTRLLPQIQDQFDPLFLLSLSGSQQARFLGKLTKLDVIVSAQMACKRDGQRLSREADAQTKLIESLTEQIQALPPVERLRQDITAVTEELGVADEALRVADRVTQLCEELSKYAAFDELVPQELEPIAALLDQAEEQVARLKQVYPLCDRYNAAQESLGEVAHDVEGAEILDSDLCAAYEKACEEAGVCDHCPFK